VGNVRKTYTQHQMLRARHLKCWGSPTSNLLFQFPSRFVHNEIILVHNIFLHFIFKLTTNLLASQGFVFVFLDQRIRVKLLLLLSLLSTYYSFICNFYPSSHTLPHFSSNPSKMMCENISHFTHYRLNPQVLVFCLFFKHKCLFFI